MKGLVLIDRGMLDHPLVGLANKDRMAIWLRLLFAASWKDRPFRMLGRVVHLKRGELVFSIRNLADSCGVSRRVTERFIASLKSASMIETRTVTGIQIISICNYDKYQSFKEYRGDSDGDSRGDMEVTAGAESGDSIGDIKEHRKKTPDSNTGKTQTSLSKPEPSLKKNAEKEVREESDSFERLWEVYPDKGCKKKPEAKKRFHSIVQSGVDPERIISAARAYATCDQVERGYVCNMDKWLAEARYDDKVETNENYWTGRVLNERWYEDQIER